MIKPLRRSMSSDSLGTLDWVQISERNSGNAIVIELKALMKKHERDQFKAKRS